MGSPVQLALAVRRQSRPVLAVPLPVTAALPAWLAVLELQGTLLAAWPLSQAVPVKAPALAGRPSLSAVLLALVQLAMVLMLNVLVVRHLRPTAAAEASFSPLVRRPGLGSLVETSCDLRPG